MNYNSVISKQNNNQYGSFFTNCPNLTSILSPLTEYFHQIKSLIFTIFISLFLFFTLSVINFLPYPKIRESVFGSNFYFYITILCIRNYIASTYGHFYLFRRLCIVSLNIVLYKHNYFVSL